MSDKAPELIYMRPDDLNQFESGMHARFSDDDIAYRRADLSHLPDELVERVRFWYARWAMTGDGTGELLRDILKAVEPKP